MRALGIRRMTCGLEGVEGDEAATSCRSLSWCKNYGVWSIFQFLCSVVIVFSGVGGEDCGRG